MTNQVEKGESKKLHYAFVVAGGLFILQFAACLIMGCASIFYTPVSEALGVSLGVYGRAPKILCKSE